MNDGGKQSIKKHTQVSNSLIILLDLIRNTKNRSNCSKRRRHKLAVNDLGGPTSSLVPLVLAISTPKP
ncbi:hypothetical protein HanIR_Chr14g0675731 [Helianthus annuus]|nr:hypothetical protein HanIR_Chr14g0675731 [Helianthus annuus]